ncbi:MAG: SRPBCC family protein [Nitrososphaerales archaeon]
MIEVEASVVIERPVEEVFAFFTDHRNDIRWQEGLLEVRVTPEGSTGIDTQVMAVRKLLNRRADSTIVICEFTPNRKEAFRTVAGSPEVSGSLVYEASGRSTVVTLRLEMQTDSFFSLPDPVVASSMRRNVATGLAEAKDWLERMRGSGPE